MFYFSQGKIKFRGRNAVTTQEINGCGTPLEVDKQSQVSGFFPSYGPVAVLMSESLFFLFSPCRSILKSRIFVVTEWERSFEKCVKTYHRLGKLFSAFFSLMIQTASNWDSPWHAGHLMCKPGFQDSDSGINQKCVC